MLGSSKDEENAPFNTEKPSSSKKESKQKSERPRIYILLV